MKHHYEPMMEDSKRRRILLACFAAELAAGDLAEYSRVPGYSYNSVKTYVYAARTTMDFYNADALQRRVLRGVLREKGRFSRERPVFEVHHLEAVLAFFDSDCYMDCLCRFAFVLLALSFSRKSSITSTTREVTQACARIGDAWHLEREYAVAFRVRDPKGDIGRYWESVGASVLYLAGQRGSQFDIVALYCTYLAHLQAHGLAGDDRPLFQEPTDEGAPSGLVLFYSSTRR